MFLYCKISQAEKETTAVGIIFFLRVFIFVETNSLYFKGFTAFVDVRNAAENFVREEQE